MERNDDVTHDDIKNEPGALRIAHRSTQANDPLRLKRHWTELEMWFRPDAGDRPPFVVVVLGCTSVPGQETRETVTEAGSLRLALSYLGDGAPASYIRHQAQSWWDQYSAGAVASEPQTYTEAQRDAAMAALRGEGWPAHARMVTLIARELGLMLETERD